MRIRTCNWQNKQNELDNHDTASLIVHPSNTGLVCMTNQPDRKISRFIVKPNEEIANCRVQMQPQAAN